MWSSVIRCAVFCLGIVIAASAAAQAPMQVYVVPVVVKSPGANNTNWSTDLFVSNLGSGQATISAHYFPAGRANTFNGTFAKADMRLNPGQTMLVEDVVGSWFPSAGSSTKGWLFIADTAPVNCNDDDRTIPQLAVSTRIFNRAGGGATYGQIVEAAWGAFNMSSEPTVFTGMRNNGTSSPGSRTNVGVANLSTVPISVEIRVFRLNGSEGGLATRQVPALSLEQWDLQSLGFPAFGAGGRLEVRLANSNYNPCTHGQSIPPGCVDRCAEGCNGRYSFSGVRSFLAYVSNVDNVTGDGEVVLPVIDHLGFNQWVSDYVDTHCPDKSGAMLQELAERLGVMPPDEPTFRKITD